LSGQKRAGGNAITLKTAAEIDILRQANRIVAETLNLLKVEIKAGVTTLRLDTLAESCARDQGAVPAFKGYHGFPGSLCVSINEQVVHGIPSDKVFLKEGDIVSIDFGVCFKGFYGDAAVTLPVGLIEPRRRELLRVTRESLYMGIEQALVGNRINDISAAIQHHVEGQGFSVVRQFVGHGIGTRLHEPPEVPNYVRENGATPRLLPGMVLAIEPMVNLGTHDVKVLGDGWTVVTRDAAPSAHFEHSIVVTEEGPLVLSEGIVSES
jgi:methionyl aminopeptidase